MDNEAKLSSKKLKCSNEREDLRDLILNTSEPLVLKDHLTWDLKNWGLDAWKERLRSETLEFRCGVNASTEQPQWERNCTRFSGDFADFLSRCKESESWLYFDYKRLNEVFMHDETIKKHVSWSEFGFPEFGADESTIWIGSKGAHTPCHIDTYGCNLVSQVYGKKRWILFPPEADLKATRIPYEESSIYSRLNFFSPNLEDFKGVFGCRSVILEPGDVLCVPHKWWHYVENLETAISINVWLPKPIDHIERVGEALTQMFIAQFVEELTEDEKKIILNPNSDQEVEIFSFQNSLLLVNKCVEICKKSKDNENLCLDLKDILTKNKLIKTIPEMSQEELFLLLKQQKRRFHSESKTKICEASTSFQNVINLINAVTNPNVISIMQANLLE